MKIRITQEYLYEYMDRHESTTRRYYPGDVTDEIDDAAAKKLIAEGGAIPWDGEHKPKAKKVK